MCQEFCSQGGSAPLHAGIPPPPPPLDRADPPGKADSPLGKETLLARQTPPWQGRPPCAVHAGRYGQQAGGMHPTGMQSC